MSKHKRSVSDPIMTGAEHPVDAITETTPPSPTDPINVGTQLPEPPADTNGKPKKRPFVGFYLVTGVTATNVTEELMRFPTIGRARKWIQASRPLLNRIYKTVSCYRCKAIDL